MPTSPSQVNGTQSLGPWRVPNQMKKAQMGPRDPGVPFGASVGDWPALAHGGSTQNLLTWLQEKFRNLHHVLGQ